MSYFVDLSFEETFIYFRNADILNLKIIYIHEF